jgi:hypothetical protein
MILVVIGLVHLYLWKRLVRDSMTGRWKRRLGAVIAVLLAVLVPATLAGVRSGHLQWLAWPGYMWLALMFYLLVTLVPLEIPRLALVLLWRQRRRAERVAGETPTAAPAAEHDKAAAPAAEHDKAAAPAARGGQYAAANPGRPEPVGKTPGLSGTAGVTEIAEAGTVSRRLVLARGMAIFAGLTAAGVTGYGVKTALGPPHLNRFVMPLTKLPRGMDGTRLALVSDIHLGPLTGTHHLRRIVDLINSVNADLVCVVGDLVDGSVAELGRFARPLADIESKRGAYFVTGNHEYYSGFAPWVAEVARLGVRPLRNERVEIGGLDLAGVNDLGGAQYGDGPDFGRALGDRDTTRPVVLMAHQPVAAKDAAPFGVDLQVSGHTHGGQMAPFNLVVKLQQPVVSGFGVVDGVPVYVTNGAGFWGPPVRVGAPPQVTLIELRTA